MNLPRRERTRPNAIGPATTRRTGLLLALATACISGVAVFVNSYGVKAFGDATTYTTAKNVVAAIVLASIIGAMSASRPPVRSLVLPAAKLSPRTNVSTRFSVCAVCGPLTVGSHICSQLPWSAQINAWPPILASAASGSASVWAK